MGGGSGTRGRTPAPLPTRQRLGTVSSGINYGTTNSSYSNIGSTYGTVNSISTPSYYSSSSRPVSRQSSVERSLDSSYANNNSSLMSSSLYGSSMRLSELGSSRSRQTSPTRSTYEGSSDRWSTSRNIASLPPQYPSSSIYDGYATVGRNRREPSTESSLVQLRNRREMSQERSLGSRPPISSALLKLRRSSFVDNSSNSLFKYY